MSKNMLDPIIRALAGVDEKHHGVVLAIANKLGGDNADEYRKRFAVVLREPVVPPPPLDTIVRVDRSAKPTYPDWMKKVENPKFECTGPAEFDLAELDLWLHDGQKNGRWAKVQVIYDHLMAGKMLDTCLNLQDLMAIQKMGIKVFRKYFQGKTVFAWKSVVRSRGGNLRVPCLVEDDGQVALDWGWLGGDSHGSSLALRFASHRSEL